MTFDEAWKQIRESSIPIQIPDEAGDAEILESDLIDIFEELRQEYAPIVEMTEGQAKTILDQERGKYLTSLLADNGKYFDYLFWEPLTDKQVAQAWLHPETIKIVDK